MARSAADGAPSAGPITDHMSPFSRDSRLPRPLAEDWMNEPMHSDLVAIGGGFAGICAAVRGAELGLRTAVLGSEHRRRVSVQLVAGPAGFFTSPTTM